MSTHNAFVAWTSPSFAKRLRGVKASSVLGKYAAGLDKNTTDASSIPMPSFMAFTKATTSGGVPFLDAMRLERKILSEVEAS